MSRSSVGGGDDDAEFLLGLTGCPSDAVVPCPGAAAAPVERRGAWWLVALVSPLAGALLALLLALVVLPSGNSHRVLAIIVAVVIGLLVGSLVSVICEVVSLVRSETRAMLGLIGAIPAALVLLIALAQVVGH